MHDAQGPVLPKRWGSADAPLCCSPGPNIAVVHRPRRLAARDTISASSLAVFAATLTRPDCSDEQAARRRIRTGRQGSALPGMCTLAANGRHKQTMRLPQHAADIPPFPAVGSRSRTPILPAAQDGRGGCDRVRVAFEFRARVETSVRARVRAGLGKVRARTMAPHTLRISSEKSPSRCRLMPRMSSSASASSRCCSTRLLWLMHTRHAAWMPRCCSSVSCMTACGGAAGSQRAPKSKRVTSTAPKGQLHAEVVGKRWGVMSTRVRGRSTSAGGLRAVLWLTSYT